jgi:exopolysaccharide biosynthesis polyprenyl glycosylphosphotransferase
MNEFGFRENYSKLFVILLLINILAFYINDSSTDFVRRGFFAEFSIVVKHNILCALWLATVMYLVKIGSTYARLFFLEFFIINIFADYIMRQYYKIFMLTLYKKSGASNKMMIITSFKKSFKLIEDFKKENFSEHLITSIAIIDKNLVGRTIYNIPVKANINNLLDVIRYEVIDEVFISISQDTDIKLDELIEELELMGIKVQLNIDVFQLNVKEKKLETFSNYNVLTFNKKEFPAYSLLIKRLIDVFCSIIGIVLTAILTVILAPAIYIESPGPIFFSQVRIGKNGRRFRIYKFRSMYVDAEERKAELLEQNEMKGFMFKLTDDPRITKVGRFIRKTSLDEFPQFLNVLLGDMSLVGTRPPTEEEFLQYDSNHRRRLSLKPGLTGLWQVSGRSDITDFEEVVRMDLEYIDTWTLGLDIKLIIKTIGIVIFGKGAK